MQNETLRQSQPYDEIYMGEMESQVIRFRDVITRDPSRDESMNSSSIGSMGPVKTVESTLRGAFS
jgi:hypothetical protein